MKRYYFLVLGFVFFSQCYAKIIDTTIFSSDFEKQLFLHRLNDPTVQNIDWFMALDYEYVCQTFLDRFHKDVFVLQKETKSQRTQKKVKTIYNSVQNEYCKKYQEEGFFNELFTGGNFNS